MLDRSKAYVVGTCGRTEDTFDGADNGEGAFVANISGPVRAIRSYIGANSYKYTVATDIFYPNREDSTVELRGHAGLPGYGQSDDFSTAHRTSPTPTRPTPRCPSTATPTRSRPSPRRPGRPSLRAGSSSRAPPARC